jgi:hypothetical protein
MMRKITMTVLMMAGMAVMVAPAAAQLGEPAQRRPALAQEARGVGPAAMARNPADLLLARADEIGLTADQVRRIQAIQARIEEENAPRVAQLRAATEELRAMAPADRRQARDRMQALQPIREQIQATHRAAGVEIHALLTAEQEARVHALRQARSVEMRQRAERRPAMGQQRPGMGQQRPGMGQQRPGMGQQRPGMGQQRPGMGQQRPGMGQQRPGMGQQRPGVAPAAPLAALQSPGRALLQHQNHIGLTEEQVRQIEAIRARVEAANAPRVEQLRQAMAAARAGTVEERRQLRERMEALQPVRVQIREANRAAGEEIHALLTPEQQARVRTLRRAQVGQAGPRGMGGRGGAWQRPGEEDGS